MISYKKEAGITRFRVSMGYSFRRKRRKKLFVSELNSIDSRMLPYRTVMQLSEVPNKRIRMNHHGVTFLVHPDHIEVPYGPEDARAIYRVDLATSRANYGNKRYWFRCPVPTCQRRCGKLYLHHSMDRIPVLACRLCYNLAYSGQNKGALDRMIDKKWKLVHRLKASSSPVCDDEKPKGMHWKTFYRKRDEIDRLDTVIMRGIANFCSTDPLNIFRSL